MDLGLAGRVAVVAGGSQGIGKAVALGFAEAGANVVILARDPDVLTRAESEIRDGHPAVEVVGIPTDVTSREAVDAAAAAVAERFGEVNVVIPTTGNRMRSGRQIAWSDEEWVRDIDAKLIGLLRTIRAFEPHLASDGSGRIVCVSGVAGTIVWETAMTHGINNSAINHLIRYLATDLAPRAITVNAVIPGLIASEWRHDWATASAGRLGITKDAFVSRVCHEKAILLGRWAEPAEVADAVLFIASSRAAYVTGTTMLVDGGLSANARVSSP